MKIDKHIELLTNLRRVIKKVPEKSFDISTIAEKNRCGTVGCVMGWAGLDPYFRARGFKTVWTPEVYWDDDKECDIISKTDAGGDVEVKGNALINEFFGLTHDQGECLFYHPTASKTESLQTIDKYIALAKVEKKYGEKTAPLDRDDY